MELPSIAQSKPLLVFDEKGEASGAVSGFSCSPE